MTPQQNSKAEDGRGVSGFLFLKIKRHPTLRYREHPLPRESRLSPPSPIGNGHFVSRLINRAGKMGLPGMLLPGFVRVGLSDNTFPMVRVARRSPWGRGRHVSNPTCPSGARASRQRKARQASERGCALEWGILTPGHSMNAMNSNVFHKYSAQTTEKSMFLGCSQKNEAKCDK